MFKLIKITFKILKTIKRALKITPMSRNPIRQSKHGDGMMANIRIELFSWKR